MECCLWAEVLTVAPSVTFSARFEWGAPDKVQIARASASFRGGPCYDVVRYSTTSGEVRFGEVRLVVRAVAEEHRDMVVVRRLRKVAPRERCVFTRFDCVRLGWYFDNRTDEWPALEAVPVPSLLRLEHMVVYW